MPSSPDVVVVGAGVVGAACAYYLASAGVRVRLYDRSFIASGSSGVVRGQRARVGQGARARAAAGPALRRPLAALAAELADDFEYDRKGSVVVAETEAELLACAERARVLAGPRRRGRGARRRRAAPRGAATPRTTSRAASCTPATRSSSRGWPPPRWSAPPSRRGAELCTDVDVDRDRARADGRAIGVETSAGLRRRGHGRRRRAACGRRSCSRPRA